MRDTRITIRLSEALLQRLERLAETMPPIPGEKRRDGGVGLSTLARLAVEDYVQRTEVECSTGVRCFLLMTCDKWENPVPAGGFATLTEAIGAVPKGPFLFGSPEAQKALNGPSFSVLDCATLQDVWSGSYETDLRPSPAVIQLTEEWHHGEDEG